MIDQTVNLEISGYAPAHASGSAAVIHCTFGVRLRRAAKAVALVWVVAIPLMFIPYLVILTLPAAIGLSIFFTYERLTALDHARNCEGTCPDCGKTQTFDLPERFELPIDVECSGCNRELTLVRRT